MGAPGRNTDGKITGGMDQKIEFVRFCPIRALKHFQRLYFVHLYFVPEPIFDVENVNKLEELVKQQSFFATFEF